MQRLVTWWAPLIQRLETTRVLLDEGTVSEVEAFFTSFPDFRTIERCAHELSLPVPSVRAAYDRLCRAGRIGAYSLGLSGPPQSRMLELLRERLGLKPDWVVLEVGPGKNPVFTRELYPRSFSVDRYQSGMYGNVMGARATADAIATYSSLQSCVELLAFMERWGAFDLVFGSHSFEHETRPIAGLTQVRSVLMPGGWLALFVPDGYSNDPSIRSEPSHTMYLTPELITDLFDAAGGFRDLEVIPWRPNWDQLILARKAE